MDNDDGLTQAGAQRLATQIKRAWSKRGYRVETRVEQVIHAEGRKIRAPSVGRPFEYWPGRPFHLN
jgi:hypothetical protein